ncbi:MAG: hypothetical protein M4579_001779 [Chaenotheca gracillima]|nr:MAG: hypothetical protein M4579_001779 [Chaenotheca gracillima]
MTVSYDFRRSSSHASSSLTLEDRFEVIKEIGDGSFGSVALARVRTAGASIARRGSVVAIKTMKKTYESFGPCLELREVIFLRSLPMHPHLVPALDIFLDPLSKKLHICMEYMDGNLYQLMKARDHKLLDGPSVKSILFQILGGLEHIHAHGFFHRDIKPENILVSTSAPTDLGNAFRRYSALATPPATPPTYSVKIADFGLARETNSKSPYTTYVSTRWYRAPEVLLRAGEYSAPVDIWAIGAMAVEIATLRPLFPGGNEVDQVWRVCEIMGSPGNWCNKAGNRIGGGDWREGTRLAQKLGFSFPKMAPHAMETILQSPHWPASLSNFVTSCLMWDPRNRPTSAQALNHEYFAEAVDPLRPKSSASRMLGRKPSSVSSRAGGEPAEGTPTLSSKPSWFRKSLIGRESVVSLAQSNEGRPASPQYSPKPSVTKNPQPLPKPRPNVTKRSTWTNGLSGNAAAPMPILPTIRPISPLSDAVTAQAGSNASPNGPLAETDGINRRKSVNDEKKKIGRQLSVASSNNHYADLHRQEAERALNGTGGLVSPPSGQKESFFSHLRKRARRLSGRHQTPMSPTVDDVEANAGCGPWHSNRSSMAIDPPQVANVMAQANNSQDLDKALKNIRNSLETTANNIPQNSSAVRSVMPPGGSANLLKRHHSLPPVQAARSVDNLAAAATPGQPISSRTRRAKQMSSHPVHRYETPDEEDELLDEVLHSTHRASRHLAQDDPSQRTVLRQSASTAQLPTQTQHQNPYPTPSPTARRNGVLFGGQQQSAPIDIRKNGTVEEESRWPTPPYEEGGWGASAAASIHAAGGAYR